MKSNDLMKGREAARELMQKAIASENGEELAKAFDAMVDSVRQDCLHEVEEKYQNMQQENDSRILSARGVRQLTSEEKQYYQKVLTAMADRNPKQAIDNLDATFPQTVINAVFDDLQTRHPLLSRIDFMPSRGATRVLMDTSPYQEAQWGELCDEIVKEAAAGFKVVDSGLLKLSAFMPVCKAALELGPEWLDTYVRQVLYEMLANGMESGIISGDGNEKPIGMIRQVGDGVTVTGGAYPEKKTIKVDDLSPATVGNLLSVLSVDPNGKSRQVRDVVLIVNPADYYSKVMPATTLMAPDGSYRNDVMPYPMTVIQSHAVALGKAAFGMAHRYFATAGISSNGRIEYSDHAMFVEDKRVYIIKAYANGMPKDNNAFLYLDISDLAPAAWKVENVTATAASNDATLSGLSLGAAVLSPAFAPETTQYTATTTSATNTINALPGNASANVSVTVTNDAHEDGLAIANGTAATWQTGANTVEIEVTAEDGLATKTYTVVVTKS